jgi:SAM-dependent methyltransferase
MSTQELETLKDKYKLSYHTNYLLEGEKKVGLSNFKILEVGGSLPSEIVIDHLGASQWVSIEAMEYWHQLNHGDGTAPDETNCIKSLNSISDAQQLRQHQVLAGDICDLPESMENHFDRIFSIACFEHVHKFAYALEKMYRALKPGGILFTMFSPIWSSYNGHHLPEMYDENIGKINFSNSPIPPWGHLLLTPSEMDIFLKENSKISPKTRAEMIYQVYQCPHINRLMTEDYINYCEQSSFQIKEISFSFPAKIPDSINKELNRLYPKNKYFSNNGLIIVLSK